MATPASPGVDIGQSRVEAAAMSRHPHASAATTEPLSDLQSGVSIPPGERPLGEAIAAVLRLPAAARAAAFARHVHEIAAWVAAHHPDRPWTCAVHRGTDGSHVFRGGVGHSLVVDPEGRLWRARSYEDFETTYDITPQTCTIATLTPLYAQMREYLPRDAEDGGH
jgi:hypothetical protein